MSAITDFWISTAGWTLVSCILGYGTSLLAGLHTKRFTERRAGKAVRKLLRFEGSEVLIVVPHQPGPSTRRLPQLAVEDVLAVRNVFEVLADIGIKHPKIRHPENLDDS